MKKLIPAILFVFSNLAFTQTNFAFAQHPISEMDMFKWRAEDPMVQGMRDGCQEEQTTLSYLALSMEKIVEKVSDGSAGVKVIDGRFVFMGVVDSFEQRDQLIAICSKLFPDRPVDSDVTSKSPYPVGNTFYPCVNRMRVRAPKAPALPSNTI